VLRNRQGGALAWDRLRTCALDADAADLRPALTGSYVV